MPSSPEGYFAFYLLSIGPTEGLWKRGSVHSQADVLHFCRFLSFSVSSDVPRLSIVMPKRTTTSSTRREVVQAAFIEAIVEGKVGRVKECYKAGASVTASDQYGWLPIHRASTDNRVAIIRLLIKWGSPLENRGTDGWTPLHLASVSRSPGAVAELLAAGAEVNAGSDFGSTPLHLEVGKTPCERMIATVQLLVAAGARPNVRDRRGRSPLREAKALVDQANRLLKAIAGRAHNNLTGANSP